MNRAFIVILTAYGILNGVLYSSLLPLWEGFDEPFHYGYVQTLSTELRLPRLGQTTLSAEVWASLQLAPASHLVQRNIPPAMTFREYFALPAAERAARRWRLQTISPALRFDHRQTPLDYEANQAPLAYLLLAPADRLWSRLPLLERVWRLRVLCATASCLFLAAAAVYLARRLALSARWAAATLFLIFSTQMFYAATAHISNDWLAVPLVALLFGAAVSFCSKPQPRSLGLLGFALAAGLLTKAYFLAFVPFVFALLLWRSARREIPPRVLAGCAAAVLAIAGPWYARNVALYGSLSGMQETVAGVGLKQAVAALGSVPWISFAPAWARASLWTGNNSFATFSLSTLNLMLVLLLLAAVLYALSLARRPLPEGETAVIAGCAFYGLGLLYAIGVSSASSRGAGIATSPWYTQPLLAPVLILLGCGLSRSGTPGRALRAAMLALWTYVIGATYFFKLIPLYAGYGEARSRFADVLRWYWQDRARAAEILSTTGLLPAGVIFGLAAAASLAAVALCIQLCRGEER